MREKETKTNAMRELEQKGIPFRTHSYPHEEGVPVDGVTVARLLGQSEEQVFKTLLTRGAGGGHYVFVLPVAEQLDLKKAARTVGEKSIAMVPMKEILGLTGYVRGGCSPVGMKKKFPTVFHETAQIVDTIVVSGGRIGSQIECEPAALLVLTEASLADIVIE